MSLSHGTSKTTSLNLSHSNVVYMLGVTMARSQRARQNQLTKPSDRRARPQDKL
jgi:hypothetical protein